MIGILTEKPSAARNFAAALGGQQGTYHGEKYVIVAARGHLYGFIKDPEKQVKSDKAERYKKWDVSLLPWDEKDFLWKYEKKKVILLCDAIRCALVAALMGILLAGKLSLPILFSFTFLISTAEAFRMPASNSFITQLPGKEQRNFQGSRRRQSLLLYTAGVL